MKTKQTARPTVLGASTRKRGRDVINAIKFATALELRLETLLNDMLPHEKDYSSILFSDVRYAKGRVADARKALENHLKL